MNGNKIRIAGREDVPALAETIRISFRDVAERFRLTLENCPKHPSNCTADWIIRDMARGVSYFVLESDGLISGCVALERADPDLCYLERLAVLPANRRCGYGHALVERSLTEAGRLGAARVSIGIIAQHTELKHWYQKLGFVEGDTKEITHLPFKVMFMSYEKRS